MDRSIDKLISELALKRGGRPHTQGGWRQDRNPARNQGLQWPIAYMIGLEEGPPPYFKADEEGTIPDERRTLFRRRLP